MVVRFKDVFSIIGPVMVGPSSSHTAGAVRIGRAANQLLGGVPEKAVLKLYGSFAETYSGHGTDLALISGLLGFETDDERIPDAIEEAAKVDLRVTLQAESGPCPHPNYAEIQASANGRDVAMSGASIGGGNIVIYTINGFQAGCSGYYPTLVVSHRDELGVLASLTGEVCRAGINIGFMNLDRKARSGAAMTVIECDRRPDVALLQAVRNLPHVGGVSLIDLNEGGGRG